MTARVRSLIFTVVVFFIGFSVSWILIHRPSSGSAGLARACSEMAQEVSVKCHEADRRRAIFEKKFPENAQSKNTQEVDAAFKSPEWERSTAWSQACEDAKAQLEETILSATEKSS